MSFKTSSLLTLGLALSAQAAPTVRGTNSSIASIQWEECSEELSNKAPLPVQCSKHVVPLDYTNQTDTRTLTLDLIRVPATKQPSLGSILLNFGGPGEEGFVLTAQNGFVLNMLSGGRYDLVGFDPRGTGKTIPFTCFTSALEQQQVSDGLALSPQSDNREALGRVWAHAGSLAHSCGKEQNETGSFIGTAFTARDLVSVATALGEADKVHYWGFSYGTTLGATLISMFPEKIERAVLDGVQNPHEYYHDVTESEGWSQSDQVFSAIFEHCLAVGKKCALSHRGNSSAALEASFWSLYESLRLDPVLIDGSVVDHSTLYALALGALYSGTKWDDLTFGVDLLPVCKIVSAI